MPPPLEERLGPQLLSEITELTGGRAFTIDNPNDLADVATKIGVELRNQYVLGYRPSKVVRDGKWRKIKVKLLPPKGLPPLQGVCEDGILRACRIGPPGFCFSSVSSGLLGRVAARASRPIQRARRNPRLPAAADKSEGRRTQQDNQQENQTDDDGVFVFQKDVDEVMLHATVVDDHQHIVTNLDKAAFTVFEDGKPQNIISFHHVDIPVAMGIVIDNSGSMREKRTKVNQAALNLVRSSNPKDEVFIVNFNDEQYLDQDFTNNLLKLKEALDKIDARGGTALYDAVVASADHLKQNARLEKKVMFVVTDGEDNASSETLEQAVKQLQRRAAQPFTPSAFWATRASPPRQEGAQDFAERTGGIAFFPKTLDEVDAISRTIANDIRNQYAIGTSRHPERQADSARSA